jgi:hypothetical protein
MSPTTGELAMPTPQHYYVAKPVSACAGGGYVGTIYHYDASGAYEKLVWQSPKTRTSPEQAIDDVCDYLETSAIELRIGEVVAG